MKDHVGEEASIDLAVLAQHRGAKRVPECDPRRLALRDDSPGDLVGVDNRVAERGESRADGALPSADPAGDGDSSHGSTVLIASHIPLRGTPPPTPDWRELEMFLQVLLGERWRDIC